MMSVEVFLVCTVLLILLVERRVKARRILPLPPGPPGLPLLGNMFDLPSIYSTRLFREWSARYDSDVIYLNVAGMSLLVVNTFEACYELLERRSAIYSDRPALPMVAQVAGWDWAFALMSYGSRWRARRKLMHQSFHFQAAKQFRPQQVDAARLLLKGLQQTPDDFKDHIQLLAARVMLTSIYGHDIDSPHHPYVVNCENAMGGFSDPNLTGPRAVEFFPMLKHLPSWFPGTSFRRDGAKWGESVTHFVEDPMEDAKSKITDGLAKKSFVSDELENLPGASDPVAQYELIKHVAANMYSGAFETTMISLKVFILTMAVWPDVQRRAQAELDKILHRDLPSFEDEASLPYIKALFMELMRWNPVLPTSVSHSTTSEDVYNGCRIPKGTIIIPNSWAMLQDEAHYPEPHIFRPERFLTSDGRINPSVRDPRLMAFGFGRRICPGRHFVESALWITMASILSVYDISSPESEDGQALNPSMPLFISGMVSAPKPYKCKITPRSAKAERVLDSIGL